MPEVYATKNGAIRAKINAVGPVAAMLFSRKERNEIVRTALLAGGRMWIGNFLPSRFSEYVQRPPFGYPKSPNFALTKLRKAPLGSPLRKIWDGIREREFFGWDPWQTSTIPLGLESRWLNSHRGQYIYQVGPKKGRIDYKEAHSDIRTWAKRRAKEYATNLSLDGVMLPLVQTGDLRDKFAVKANATATSTTTRSRLTITIPRGDRQNKWAVRLLAMLPVWEFNAIVKTFSKTLDALIAEKFMANATLAGPATARGIAGQFLQDRADRKAAAVAARKAARNMPEAVAARAKRARDRATDRAYERRVKELEDRE